MSETKDFDGWWKSWTSCPRCEMSQDLKNAASNAWYISAQSQSDKIAELQAEIEDLKSLDAIAHAKYMEEKYVRAACEIVDLERKLEIAKSALKECTLIKEDLPSKECYRYWGVARKALEALK